MTELRSFNRYGPSLVATVDYAPGDVVLTDDSIVSFDTTQITPDTSVETCDKWQNYPGVLPALEVVARGILDLSDIAVIRQLLAMHTPDVPMEKSAMSLLRLCSNTVKEKACRLQDDHARSSAIHMNFSPPSHTEPHRCATPCALFRACGISVITDFPPEGSAGFDEVTGALFRCVLACKVNAHRAENGLWALYPTASKLAHSCDPNCFYVPLPRTVESSSLTNKESTFRCAFIALKPIRRHECLSFSYFSGPSELMATPARQKSLLRTHMFLCACSRCREFDWCRQLPCPKCTSEESNIKRDVLPRSRFTHSNEPHSNVVRIASCLSITDDDAYNDETKYGVINGKVWRCFLCASVFSDQDLSALINQEVEIIQEVESALDSKTPCQVKALVPLYHKTRTTIGEKHFLFAQVVQQIVGYFIRTASALSTNPMGMHLLTIATAWFAVWIDCLVSLRVIIIDEERSVPPLPHVVVTSQALSLIECFIACMGETEGNKDMHELEIRDFICNIAQWVLPTLSALCHKECTAQCKKVEVVSKFVTMYSRAPGPVVDMFRQMPRWLKEKASSL